MKDMDARYLATLTGQRAELVMLPKAAVQALLDIAVSSMDFGSGFWEQDETDAARYIAKQLGVDPLEATPPDMRKNYPHSFVTRETRITQKPYWEGGAVTYTDERCKWCGQNEWVDIHTDGSPE